MRDYAVDCHPGSNINGPRPTGAFRRTNISGDVDFVFLDVTVLDKQGHPVMIGLNKDDFTITEDKKPERIFSFEAPESHVMGTNAKDVNPDGKAPVTIIVLDLLNSSFSDFAYIRDEVKKFLETQPAQLAAPAELMVVGNESLEMLQGYAKQPVECFEGDIRQVLSNLVGNAIDAMPRGGRLVIRSREGTEWSSGRVGLFLTVADSGCGISTEARGKLFEAFFTTKGIGGTGLGLWISAEIMERHQGRIRLRSSQNPDRCGTTVTLFLPNAG